MAKRTAEIDRELAVKILQIVGIEIPVSKFKIEWAHDGITRVMVEYYPALVEGDKNARQA